MSTRFAVIIILFACAIAIPSACQHPSTAPTPLPQASCLTDPPPKWAPVQFHSCGGLPDGGSPDACLDVPNSIALRDDLIRNSAWVRNAWIKCGPLPAADGGP